MTQQQKQCKKVLLYFSLFNICYSIYIYIYRYVFYILLASFYFSGKTGLKIFCISGYLLFDRHWKIIIVRSNFSKKKLTTRQMVLFFKVFHKIFAVG